jgi:hypothetical protein
VMQASSRRALMPGNHPPTGWARESACGLPCSHIERPCLMSTSDVSAPAPPCRLCLVSGEGPEPPSRLSTSGASKYTGLAESTLRYYRHAGIGPASYAIGSKVFYDRADLDEWRAAQKAASVR